MRFLITMAFFLICLQFSTFAQGNKIDDRLLLKYSQEELKSIKKSDPEQLKFLTYCIENAFYLADIPQEKMQNNEGRIGKITLKDINSINFYDLGIDLIQNDYQYFAIEGTNKLLVLKSIDHIKKEMK